MFFLNQLKSDMLANICTPKRSLDKRLFYRRHASLSFYTAKTQSGPMKVRMGGLGPGERGPRGRGFGGGVDPYGSTSTTCGRHDSAYYSPCSHSCWPMQ